MVVGELGRKDHYLSVVPSFSLDSKPQLNELSSSGLF